MIQTFDDLLDIRWEKGWAIMEPADMAEWIVNPGFPEISTDVDLL